MTMAGSKRFLAKSISTPLVSVVTDFSFALSMVGRSSSTVALIPARVI